MDVSINIPEQTFARATEQAATLGITLSEVFTYAADRYLQARSLTEQVDIALERIGGADDSNAVAVAAGRARLRGRSEEW